MAERQHHILLLASSLYIGGAERVIANLAKHLNSARFRVTVCHLKERGSVGEELQRLGFDVVGVERRERGIGRYLSFRGLAQIVRERNIDLIHSHTTYGLTDASLCKLAGGGSPRLVHTFHFGNYPHCPRRYLWMERLFARFADQLVAVGLEQAEVIRATHFVRPDRIKAIVNGVEPPVADVHADWQRRLMGSGKIVIGTICTFIEQKGLPDLLAAAAQLCRREANAIFVVVGDGPLRATIEERARVMGLHERIIFAGWIDAAAMRIMPLFDIFFQPSLWEAMSMVVLEAMAAGKPTVVTDVGDNRHVVLDGVTGYVVPRGDTERMAEALQYLVSVSELRRSFGESGRQRYQEHYTVQHMIRQYEDLYLSVLNRDYPRIQLRAAGAPVRPDKTGA